MSKRNDITDGVPASRRQRPEHISDSRCARSDRKRGCAALRQSGLKGDVRSYLDCLAIAAILIIWRKP